METTARIPVTILTGWLGAGKTTLLNRILAEPAGRRFAVLVNEFGELSIDDRLVVATEEDLVEIEGGCVCCTVRGDLVEALERIHARSRGGFLRRARPVDHVLIETTGLAEPAPLLRTFLVEENVKMAFAEPAVVTVVDASKAERSLSESAAREQVAIADRLLLNKTDLVDAEALNERRAQLETMNPLADVALVQQAECDVLALLATPTRGHELELEGHAHEHVHDITSISLVEERPIDEMKLRLWLDACVHMLGENLLRSKGFLHVANRPERVILHGVYDTWSTTPGEPWGDAKPRTEVVFIGRELDAGFLQRGLEASLV